MFKRRIRLSTIQRLVSIGRQFLNPSKIFRYYKFRLVRIRATPHNIALGFSIGVAISMTPLVGFHFLLSLLLAWIVRANIIGALLGTIIGNPITFPFIWLATYKVGMRVLNIPPHIGKINLNDLNFISMLSGEFGLFFKTIFLPMMIGSIPLGLLLGLLIYLPIRFLVAPYQKKYARRRLKINRKETHL